MAVIRWSDLSNVERNLMVHTLVMRCESPFAGIDLDEESRRLILASLRTGLPNYISDPSQVRRVEEEITRRDRLSAYAHAICRIRGYVRDDQGWLVEDPIEMVESALLATPAQRCFAALQAVGMEVVL